MNRLVKAGVAAAAGIALLMGGAGTLAYWNAQADLSAGTISSGHLTLTSNNDGAWDDPDLDYIVPGDTVTYTGTYTLSALGDNLNVLVEAAVPSVTGLDAITVTSTVTVDGTPVPAAGLPLTEGDYDVAVSVVVDFPWGVANPGTEDMDEVISLGNVEVTATQTT